MEQFKTSLSAGEIVRYALLSTKEVTDITTNVYPLAADESVLPYIVYRRAAFEQIPTKGIIGSDSVQIEIACYAATYAESVALAEATRKALDHKRGECAGLTMRSCTLIDSEESWQDDAYLQLLTFKINI